MKRSELKIDIPSRDVEVDAILDFEAGARCLYVMAHGAGAGMNHQFMESMSGALNALDVATLRFNFPYWQAGRRGPDRPAVLKESIEQAVRVAAELAPTMTILAGGKSMGGRLSSAAAADGLIPAAKGLVFLGFPLHAPGKQSTDRAKHLPDVAIPMLFLQGTRDRLAQIDLMQSVVNPLETSTLHILDDGDHSFKVPKRAGKTSDEVIVELADATSSWVNSTLGM